MDLEEQQKQVDNLFLEAIKNGDLKNVKYFLNEAPLKANINMRKSNGYLAVVEKSIHIYLNINLRSRIWKILV